MKTKTKAKTSLSRRALLVTLNISQWTARKRDTKATATVIKKHKADKSAGSYNKRLLPGAQELEKVRNIASQARTYYYTQTLPWLSDGTRILSAKNYLAFIKGMAKFESEFKNAVKDFVAAYPKLKSEAVLSLGDLYVAEEYPEDIESKFNIETKITPFPDVSDFRVKISEGEKKEFLKNMREVESKAMKDAWSRVHEVVKNAVDKLKNPDTIFRDSLLNNITEITDLLPLLNISQDPKLDSTAREVKALVSKLNADTLRKDFKERAKATKALAGIESKMSVFMKRS